MKSTDHYHTTVHHCCAYPFALARLFLLNFRSIYIIAGLGSGLGVGLELVRVKIWVICGAIHRSEVYKLEQRSAISDDLR